MKKQLNKSIIKELNSEIESLYSVPDMLGKKDKVETFEDGKKKLVLLNDGPVFFYHEGKLVPCLKLLLKNDFLKKVTVDMGAVKFVAGGADIMRPGITAVEDGINEGDAVSIIDEKNSKELAVGITMFSGEELMCMDSGKVIKTVHFVGDKVWDFTTN